MAKKILFLAHRSPYPPNKGERIRAYHLLKHLSSKHQVWLGAPVDPEDMVHIDWAKDLCVDAFFAPSSHWRGRAKMLGGLIRGAPLSVARFQDPALQKFVDETLVRVEPDLVFAFSSAMAAYISGPLPARSSLFIDFVDADAQKWKDYAARTPQPMKALYALEAKRLTDFEAPLLARARGATLVSETEAALLKAMHPQWSQKIHSVPNGVDTDFFAPTATTSEAGLIVFCGTMDYLPNVDGSKWFAQNILPKVRAIHPAARFRIVGARPSSEVQALARIDGVEVTGSVPDVRPHLAAAEVIVAPLRIARGIQNKVLEAMAAGRPTVATSQALDGIKAVIGRDVLVADDEGAFANAVAQVISQKCPPDLGERGRQSVLAHHQWQVQFDKLDALIET